MMMFGDCCSCLVLLFMFGDFVCLCSFKLVFLNFGDVRASVCVCLLLFMMLMFEKKHGDLWVMLGELCQFGLICKG